MKKIYMKPELNVEHIAVMKMISSSPNVTLSKEGSVDPSSFDTHADNGWDIWGNEDASEE